LLRLLLLLLLRRSWTLASSAAPATTPSATSLTLGARLLLLLLRPLTLRLRLRGALGTLLLRLPLSLPIALLRLIALTTRTLFAGRTIFLARDARPLFELPNLPLHEAARVVVLFAADLVVPAIRAPLPSLGIGPLAGRAGDAFRQRHRKSARIVHFESWMKAGAKRCAR
jgi:hypothetical protein